MNLRVAVFAILIFGLSSHPRDARADTVSPGAGPSHFECMTTPKRAAGVDELKIMLSDAPAATGTPTSGGCNGTHPLKVSEPLLDATGKIEGWRCHQTAKGDLVAYLTVCKLR